MTVSELIKALKREHQRAEVLIHDPREEDANGNEVYRPIDYVYNVYIEPLSMDDESDEAVIIQFEIVEPEPLRY